jgi:hypothetical protein
MDLVLAHVKKKHKVRIGTDTIANFVKAQIRRS